jgi:hypothetical protein
MQKPGMPAIRCGEGAPTGGEGVDPDWEVIGMRCAINRVATTGPDRRRVVVAAP